MKSVLEKRELLQSAFSRAGEVCFTSLEFKAFFIQATIMDNVVVNIVKRNFQSERCMSNDQN